MPERFLGIQTPHDSGRTGSLPFRPGLHPARPPLSCDHTKTSRSMASIRAQTDRQRSPPRSRWRDVPRHKGRNGKRVLDRPGRRAEDVQFLVVPVTSARVPGVCSRRSDRRRQSRPRRARRHLFDPRLVAKLRSPHRPRRDHRPSSPAMSASAVPCRPPSLMRPPAVRSSLAPLPPLRGQHHEAANLAAGLTPGSRRPLSSRRSMPSRTARNAPRRHWLSYGTGPHRRPAPRLSASRSART